MYSDKTDLRVGDIPLPVRHGDGSGMVRDTADEMDAQIGHLYVTPVVVADTPENRPTRLLLKRINNLLASGRLVLDMAAAGEDRELHAYGASMVMEALELLGKVSSGEISLTGADRIESETGEAQWTGPAILNSDLESLVEGFYQQYGRYSGIPAIPMAPYKPVGE